MKYRLLTGYEKAEVWSRITILSERLAKMSKKQNLVECRKVSEEIAEQFTLLTRHEVAQTLENGKNNPDRYENNRPRLG